MLPLAFTRNKQVIRQLWDKPIIAQFSKEINKPLDYFGLPGPDIQDFIDWGDLLGWKTGIEVLVKTGPEMEEQRRKIGKLQRNVMIKGFNENWELRKGTLEDIILEGVDIDGNKPHLFTINKVGSPRLEYDLHNWDFQSGLGYQNRTYERKRLQALQKCFEFQRNHPFVLLLTLNVRHHLGEEPSTYLQGAAREITSNKYEQVLIWYSQRGKSDNTDRYRTKLIVPLIVRQFAHVNSFDCLCYPPIYYQGFGDHLLHFVFVLRPRGKMLPTFSSTQLITEVIDLPLLEAGDGKISISTYQHPECDLQVASRFLTQHGLAIGITI